MLRLMYEGSFFLRVITIAYSFQCWLHDLIGQFTASATSLGRVITHVFQDRCTAVKEQNNSRQATTCGVVPNLSKH